MKNKKRNAIITCIVIGLILLGSFTVFLLNNSLVDNGLSVLEKKWINDRVNQVLDIRVYNDVPVYGYSGNGVNFDFLDYFTDRYKISFNKISYYTSSNIDQDDFGFFVLNSNEAIGKQDILFDMDHYVILGSDKNYHIDLSDVSKLGILKSDLEIFQKYFSSHVEFIQYDSINDLMDSISKKEVDYISVPVLQNMSDILSHGYDIVYHIDDLRKKYVLRVKDATEYEILRKTYYDYMKKNYQRDYSKNYLSVYFNAINASDVSRKNYNSKVYHYGYVVNMPYENYFNHSFVGTISNYLTGFGDVTYAEIEVHAYPSIDDLKVALVSGEIDFALGNFDYDTLNLDYVTTNTLLDLDYFVLSKKNLSINSIKGLNGENVSVVSGSILANLCKDNGVSTKGYLNTDELLRSLDDESVVLLDEETYQYYKDSKLKDYSILLEDKIKNGYRFLLNSNNSTFNQLFQFYVNSISYNNYRYDYHTDVSLEKDYTMLKMIIFIVGLLFFLAATIWFMNRKSVSNVVTKKDEVLKYIDPMTSLKNRSYLNKNIYSWDDNVIFPQAIIVFDLTHLKKVNDKFGRETGDEVIKKVASILIDYQLENTDIIRSDGDEFIIYMVGYEEQKVKEHMRKLQKIMKDIPKSLGIDAGYSMIFDEVKTVDDAINEAILMLMNEKEKKQGGQE